LQRLALQIVEFQHRWQKKEKSEAGFGAGLGKFREEKHYFPG
jgi:hypothetical protein